MTRAIVVLTGACFGIGFAGLVVARLADKPFEPRRNWALTLRTRARGRTLAWGAAGMAGVVVGLATGWPVAVPLVAVATIGLPKLFGQTSGSASITKMEAIAVWTEMLQGTLAASAGLSQAILATAPLSPPTIRSATTRLSARLSAGMASREALLLFADELEDSSADRVVCALLLATSSRALRLGDLLMALADSTRDEVALRLRIETSRSAIRSGVRTVLVFSVAFVVALTFFAHSYLAPLGSPTGQFVLALVGVLYGIGLTLMVALARPPAPVRLLGSRVVEQ